jgi:hypothetical protein
MSLCIVRRKIGVRESLAEANIRKQSVSGLYCE